MPDQKPWEKYASQQGPWSNYAKQPQPPQITAPKMSDFIPSARTPLNFAEGLASGAGQMVSGLGSLVAHPIQNLENAGRTAEQAYDEARHGAYIPAAATAMGLIGFNEPRMAQLWSQGQGARAVGEATPMAASLAYGGEKALGRGPATIGGESVMSKIPAPSEFIVNHPGLVKGAGTLAGGVIGRDTGLGELGTVYGGYRIGSEIVRQAEDKLINDAIEGKRPVENLPARLMPRYMRELNARADAYARQAAQAGKPVDTIKLPSGLKEAVSYEERARMKKALPNLIQTPEEIAQREQGGRAARVIREQLRPHAEAGGMAHAAGSHELEYVPSKVGVSRTLSSRLRPRRP